MKACLIFFNLLQLVILLQVNDTHGQTCDEIKYITINDIQRSTAYKPTRETISCDRGYIKNDNWYRFDSVAGKTMPTQNPGNNACGTFMPIWFKGTHPSKDNNVTSAKACVAKPFIKPIGCGASYDIKVIKCGTFYLYRLREPNICHAAYCAGTKLPKKCSVTGETLPVCPGAIPRLTAVIAKIKAEKKEDVTLNCYWESPGNLSNIEYEARWYGDEKDLEHKIQRNFTGLDTPEFFFQPETVTNNAKTGYEFHKKVYCAVRARYKTGTWSKWVASRRIYTGIEVFPTFIPINDCGEKDREVIITLRPHLPIRVKPVKIDIVRPTNKLIDEICVVGDKGFQDCGIVFKTNHRVGRPLRFKLMTNCGTGDKSGNQDATYELNYLYADLANINKFWVHHQFPVIKVSRRKFKKKQCWSTGDPHFSTFDSKRYDFFGRGTFLLYRNKFYGTEIQVRQRACNGGTPSCNCGVAIRENLFYKIYDMCYTTPGRPWWENNVRSRLRTSTLRDFKLSRFYSKISQQGSTAKYEITLPSGVKVIVDRRNWGLNLYVWAPADPNNPSEGLCGNNNGNSGDDFGQWNTANQFGEHWRIRSPITLFDYKGNKFEEAQLDDGCDQKICVCSRGTAKRCGGEAENICFPDLGSADARAHHKGSGIGQCRNRVKREAVLDDDTVDDQDTIPTFDPEIKRVNLTLTWPTQSGITKDNVTQFCEKKLLYSKAGQACGQLSGVNVDSLVQQCITDIQATEDFSWAAGNFAALETSCIANIFNNISSFKNTTDGSIELNTDVLTSLCPNDCSDHGNCSNSTCTCEEDFTAPDCSISLNDSPLVFDIRKSGLCDVRRRPCRNVGIFGFPLLASENLTCHVQEYKVIDSAWTPSNSIMLYPGLLVDLTEVKCSLPESPVNIGDYGNEGVTAAGLKIAVSNNRVNASKDSMLFITYDSVCQECNTTTGCRLRKDACFISGHCFAKNDSNPRDWCQQCLPELSTSSWSERKDNRQPIFTTSSVLFAFKDKQLRVKLNAEDPENRTIHYSFEQNETFGASLINNGSFAWTTSTKNITGFLFKVTDECGAYSVHNALVVIKECPCKNSGECHPDYRYLDGAGNFTCSCPAEYTGSLCEDDVNECTVSKPCNNGTCTNEQPGFSCSCFSGYTGDRCQTEVDECASNPCFPGVSCTDMIATYICGSCFEGYSGNGENCTRLDGEIDECIKNRECHNNGECMYNNGSYMCQCTHGYIGDGKDNCTDVNECLQTPKVCHPYANCSNIPGSFSCQCLSGFSGKGTMNCTDIDECKQSPSVCHPLANCSNIEGSFSCQCRQGYTGDGIVNCTDIDECLTQSPCHEYATCTNLLMGRYLCECSSGYVGDGERNCTENQPLQFSTPNAVYAILNEDFNILIKAKDPESQDVTFTLLSNGSLTAVSRITEQGQLTISDLKENGTVYIQVKDEMGGQNILILHVNAMQCPCEHNGACYQNKTILYPVQPSDYLCQCEEPYTGDLCEIRPRPNPCDEQPCYPGLNCSQTSEGFTCEDCPPLFEGDGENCELNTTQEKNTIGSKIKLTNQEWSEQLRKKTSKEYMNLVSLLVSEIRKLYQHLAGFSYVIIKSFRQGSVIVDFELIFTKEVNDPLEPLNKVAKTGKLGNITFEMDHLDDDKDESTTDSTFHTDKDESTTDSTFHTDKDESTTEDEILGLDKTIFIIIIVSVVVLIVIIVIAVCLRKQRRSDQADVTLNKYVGVTHMIINDPEGGIAFQETAEKNKGEDEEIDLKVFHDDKVCVEETIKIKP